jgi:hypothetical protein
VFLIEGLQATDLSAFGSGLNKFFTDHLAFEILRYYPNVNTDNHYDGIGLHGVFDSKYDRVIISKLDYIPNSKNIKYDATNREFYIEKTLGNSVIRTVVSVYDSEYFCNKSWTLSFSMNTKSWISFHSYIPNFYIAENNFFYSGLNGGCDLEAITFSQIPCTTTTTTSTTKDCRIVGTAVDLCVDCTLIGTAINPCCIFGTAVENCSSTTTTTTSNSTSTTTTTVPPGPTTTTTTTTTVTPTTTTTTSSTTTTTTTSSTTTTTTTVAPVPTTTTTTSSTSTSTTTTTTTAPPAPECELDGTAVEECPS